MSLRVLHVLDHSIPLQSGYVFRTLAILREQRARGWQTLQLTSPKQGGGTANAETVDGWTFGNRSHVSTELRLIVQPETGVPVPVIRSSERPVMVTVVFVNVEDVWISLLIVSV